MNSKSDNDHTLVDIPAEKAPSASARFASFRAKLSPGDKETTKSTRNPTSFHADLVTKSKPRLSAETQDILQSRLKAAGLLLVAALLLSFWRDLLLPDASTYYLADVLSLTLLVTFSAFLFFKKGLSYKQLRGIELAIMATATLAIGFNQYQELAKAVASGSELVQARLAGAWVGVIWLVLIYGMFIPNTWKRAVSIMLPITLMPPLIRTLISLRYPELRQLIGPEQVSYSLLLMLVTLGSGVFGAHVINRLRKQVFEAKELGQYHLVEKIGSGGMGEVWKARHRMLARPAAVKVIRPEMLGAQDAQAAQHILRRFEREAQATAALTSPHSIALYDFGLTDEGVFYYVMELLDGSDMETFVERFGPLPPGRVAFLLQQACESLEDAHHYGLIHRDIKPANIFSCRLGLKTDFTKVLDFGLVKTSSASQFSSTQLTQAGMATGTPAYISPEQATGEQVDSRADIYSLGCVGYWLLTGKLVFDASNAMSMIIEHVKSTPEPPSAKIEEPVPTDLESLILSCLAKSPDDRPQSATELGAKLRECECYKDWDWQKAASWWHQHLPDSPGSVDLSPNSAVTR
jgi:serine/threonine-protein kinase